jgi:putative transferase (TIGR04331 family)
MLGSLPVPTPKLKAFEERFFDRVIQTRGAAEADAIWLGCDDPPLGGILLAGWWCSPDQGPGIVVLPNPWDDRDAIGLMDAFCWTTSERIIEKLAPRLSEAHGCQCGVDYWSLVLGPWMIFVVSAIADRSLYLRAASIVAPGAPVLTVPASPPPTTMDQTISGMLRSVRGNAELMSMIAVELGLTLTDGDDPQPSGYHGTVLTTWSERLELVVREPVRLLGYLAQRFSSLASYLLALQGRVQGASAIVGNPCLRASNQLALRRRIGAIRVMAATSFGPPSHVDFEMRTRIFDGIVPDGQLESLVLGVLPEVLPSSIIEGFPAVRAVSRDHYGQAAAVVSNGYGLDEVQNEFIARVAADGGAIAFVQHGGFYGQAKVNAQERLEVAPRAPFWSWGTEGTGVFAVASPRLESLRSTHRGGEQIVLVEGVHPPDRYLLRFASTPLGNQGLIESTRLAKFVDASERMRGRMALRRFPPVVGAGPRPEALEGMPNARVGWNGSAVEAMQRARLVVVPYPDTPFIEAMVIGVPTIGLWSASLWEWRDDAEEILEMLRNANIVFDDPAAAAAHVDDVVDRAEGWWASPEVVDARAGFIRRFAREGSWLDEWELALSDLSFVQE